MEEEWSSEEEDAPSVSMMDELQLLLPRDDDAVILVLVVSDVGMTYWGLRRRGAATNAATTKQRLSF